MADKWNDNAPAVANQVSADVADIEENFGWLRRLVRMCVGWKDSTIGTVGCLPHRSKFRWKDADEIYIDPGSYFLDGTVRQVQFWDATITFKLGSAGSNAGSSDLGASDWQYIYIDDSTMADGTSEISAASKFINSTTEPAWSDSKHGWYNGADLCIFAVYTDGGSEVTEFNHGGGDYVSFAEEIADRASADLDATWTDVSLTLPIFSTEALVTALADYVDTTVTLKWRTNGVTATGGHTIELVASGKSYNPVHVITDSSQKIEIKFSAAGGDKAGITTSGFFLPETV